MLQLIFLLLFSTLASAKLTHESEVSTLTTGGNSNVETYLVKTNNQYEIDIRLLKFGGHYTYGEAAETVSSRDWDGFLRYEQMLKRDRLALAVGEIVEGYQFQGIKARYNSDLGLKYYFIKKDLKNFFSEAGYRYTIEDRYQNIETLYEHKARFYTEYNQKVTETFQYRLWAEYVHNLTHGTDYLITYEASITAILTSVFSLKVSYKGIYDEVPAIEGNKNYDYTYTTSLVAKF